MTPYSYDTLSEGSYYSAIEISCGDSHSALLIRDNSLPPLKLVYSSEIPISKIFGEVIEAVKRKYARMSDYHAKVWDSSSSVNRDQVLEFFNEFVSNYDLNEEIIFEITDLLMAKAQDDGTLLYKEFRDQLNGYRLDDGRVLTWGSSENGRLGRGQPKPDENSKERLVVFPEDISITKISCGGSHTLAVSMGRKLFAWGANAYGQLGIGNTIDQ